MVDILSYFRKKKDGEFIRLSEAAKLTPYSQEYLNLRARQGKLKATKIGRDWFTTREWLDEFLRNSKKAILSGVISTSPAQPNFTKLNLVKLGWAVLSGFRVFVQAFRYRVGSVTHVWKSDFQTWGFSKVREAREGSGIRGFRTIIVHPSPKARRVVWTAVVFVTAFSVLVFVSVQAQFQKADVYSSECRGSWNNSRLAEGKPDVDASGDEKEFTEENSSKYAGGDLSMDCGGFTEIPEGRVKLRRLGLSLAIIPKKEVIEIPQLPAPSTETSPTEVPPEEIIPEVPGEEILPRETEPEAPEPVEVASRISPRAVAWTAADKVRVGDAVIFDGSQSSDPDSIELFFIWDFGDEMQSTEKIATHIYSKPGRYSVTLRVSDGESESLGFLTITVQGYGEEPKTENGEPEARGDTFFARISRFLFAFVSAQLENEFPTSTPAETPPSTDTSPTSSTDTPSIEETPSISESSATSTEEITPLLTPEVSTTTEETLSPPALPEEEVPTSTEPVSPPIEEPVPSTEEPAPTEAEEPIFEILISFDNGETWEKVGIVDTLPFSNSENNGYFFFDLPNSLFSYERRIENMKVRVQGLVGSQDVLEVYLDSLWVELTLTDPREAILEAERVDFAPNEKPHFRIRVEDPKTFLETVRDALPFVPPSEKVDVSLTWEILDGFGGIEEKVPIEFTPVIAATENEAEWEIVVSPLNTFRPGRYTFSIKAVDPEWNILEAEKDFNWGLLAINTPKTVFLPADAAELNFTVLSETGVRVCDAFLSFTITDPDGSVEELSTDGGSITSNPLCETQAKNTSQDALGAVPKQGVILGVEAGPSASLSADYTADWRVGEDPGEYTLELSAVITHEDGREEAHKISDALEVKEKEDVLFDITRFGPTRILPGSTHEVRFQVIPKEDYTGPVIEHLPPGFKISNTGWRRVLTESDFGIPFLETEPYEASFILWNAELEGGNIYEFGYTFTVPDEVPEFWLLGPLAFYNETGGLVQAEAIGESEDQETVPLGFEDPKALTIINKDQLRFAESRYWQVTAAKLTLDKKPKIFIEDFSVFGVVDKKDFKTDEEPAFKVFAQPEIDVRVLLEKGEAELLEGELQSSEVELPKIGGAVSMFGSPTSKHGTFKHSSTPSSFVEGLSRIFGIREAFAQRKENIKAKIFGPNGEESPFTAQILPFVENGQEKFSIKFPTSDRSFAPGKYRLEIELETRDVIYVSTQDFTWGVLAINVDKSMYRVGERAYIQMGVLDERGHTLCGAQLELHIRNPRNEVKRFSTGDGTITKSPECSGNSVTSIPDYFTYYDVDGVGGYELTLIAGTANGRREVRDSFEVRDFVQFDVIRIGPTRIYPPSPYDVELRIKAQEDFSGIIREYVPHGFSISGSPRSGIKEFSTIETRENEQIIIWEATIKKGNELRLGYRFDAPDVSPEFYLLGPLEFVDTKNALQKLGGGSDQVIFKEIRSWQIASDAVKTFYFHKEVSALAGNWLLKEAGPDATPVDITTQDTTGGTNNQSILFKPGVNNSAVVTGHGATTTQGFGWWSDTALSGTFASGAWTFVIRNEDNRAGITSHFDINVFRVPQNSTTTSAVLLFSHVGTVDFWGGAIKTTTETSASVGPFTLSSEYLLIEIWDHTTAGANAGRISKLDVDGSELAAGDQTRVTTPDFGVGISVSGNAYEDEATTTWSGCDGATARVALVVGGATSTPVSCNATTGAFTFSGVSAPATGTAMTIWFDGLATNTGSTINRYTGSGDATGTPVRRDRVTVAHADAGPTTNTNLNNWDNDNDTDINFVVTAGALTVEDGSKLIVNTGDTFTPGGSVTTSPSGVPGDADGDLLIQSTATLSMGTNALSVGGDYTNSGTFSKAAGQTTTFTSTATGFTIAPGTGNFDSVTFNGTGGGWSFSAAVVIDIDLTVTAGTLSGTNNISVNGGDATGDGTINLTGGTFTLDGGGSLGGATAWTFSSFTLGDGVGATTTTASGAGGITVSSIVNIAANQTLNAAGKTWTLSATGTPFSISGTFTAATSTFQYTGNGVTNITSTTYNNLSLIPAGAPTYTLATGTAQTINTNGNVVIGDGTNGVIVTANTNNPTLNVDGNFTISAAATFQASGSGTFSVAGNWSNSGTFTHNSGTVTFDSTAVGKTLSGTMTGTSSFNNAVFNGTGGEWSMNATATIATDLTMTAGTLIGTSSITVNGGDVIGNGTINLTGGTFLLDGAGLFGGTTAWTFSSLTFGDGAGVTTSTATSTGAITVSSILTIAANQTLDAGSKTWTLSAAGTPFSISGTFTPSTSTFNYTGNGAVTVAATTYNNLTFSPLITVSRIYTAGGAITANGNLDLNPDAASALGLEFDAATTTVVGSTTIRRTNSATSTLDTTATNYPFTSGTIDIQTGGELRANASTITLNATAGTLFTRTGTFTQGTSTVVMNPNASVTLTSGAITFNNLRLTPTVATASKTYTFGTGAITVNGNFDINPTAATALGLEVDMGATTTVAGTTTITRTTSATSTLDTVAGSNFAFTTGILTIATATSMTANNSTITVSGNWTNNGTFVQGNSTVVFNASATLSGSGAPATTFHHFTDTTAGTTLQFTAGQTFRMNGILTLTGTSGNQIHLHSTATPTQWFINHQGTESVTFSHLHDAGCDGTSTDITMDDTSTDGGNNGTCWRFGITVSGTVFQTDETTALATQPVVKLAVGATTAATTTAAVSGAFTFSGVTQPASGTIMTIWLDTGAGTDKGSLVFKYGGNCTGMPNCTGLSVFQNRVIIDSKDGTSMANSNLSACDNDTGTVCSDTDIGFTSAPLSLTFSTNELHITSGITFAPGGNVTAQKLHVAGTYTGGSEVVTLTGSGTGTTCGAAAQMPLCVGGTYSANTNTTKFTGTSASNIALNSAFNNLEMSPAATVTYTLGTGVSQTLTVNGGLLIGDATNALTLTATSNNPTISVVGNATSTASSIFTVGTGTQTFSADLRVDGTVNGAGSVTVNGGDVTGNGTITLTGGTFTLDSTGSFGGNTAWTFVNLTFGDGAGAATSTATGTGGITISGDLTIAASQVLDPQGKTWTLSGTDGTPLAITGTLNDTADSSTFTFTGNNTGGDTSIPASTGYHHITLNNGAEVFVLGGAVTMSGDLTVTAGTISEGVDSITVNGGDITGNGTITFTGSTTVILDGAGLFGGATAWSFANLTLGDGVGVTTSTATNTGAITVSSALTIAANQTLDAGLKLWTLSATGTPFSISGTLTPTSSTFRYTATGAATVTAATYNILELRPSGAGSPTYNLGSGTLTTNSNFVIGDGTNAVTITAAANNPTLNVDGAFTISTSTTFTASNSATFSVFGNWANTGTFNRGTGTVTFDSTATGRTITDGGWPFYNITFSGVGGGWTYQDATSTAPNQTTVSNGTVTYINAKTGTVSVTGGTLNVDWYLSVHAVDKATPATNIDTAANQVTISETSTTSAATVFKHNGTDWGTATSSQQTETLATGHIPQPNTSGAIRIREYARTSGGTTYYQYNLVVDDQTSYGGYNYFADEGSKYIASTAGATDTDQTIGALWHRPVLATEGAHATLDEPPTNGTWYIGMIQMLTFTISGTSVNLGALDTANNFTYDAATVSVSFTTSASSGATVRTWSTQTMTRVGGSETIADWTATNSAPSDWNGNCVNNSECGFGYTTNDATLTGGTANRFSAGTCGVDSKCWAAFVHSGPGDPVADSTTRTTSQSNLVTFKISVSNTQAAGEYNTVVIFIATAQY